MNRIVKTALFASAAWSAFSAVAVAQDAAQSNQATALDDVVVTARRTEESAQRTPLSLSAFSGEQLERQGAQQVTDLQGAVPNLNIVQGRGSSNATNIYIRGIGQPDALQTFDPAVGVYVDDVYYSRIRGTQFDLLDLERVEVLRGPQGTLYGKNTIGGALKLVSRRPGQEFRARGSVAYGDYDLIDVQGGRTLFVPKALKGVAVFSFKRLCGEAKGAADYLAIARRFHTVILVGIPKLGPENRNEAARFVTLIDALYDNRVKLLAAADALPDDLYPAGDGSFEFQRTASRLSEMGSADYLAEGHGERDEPVSA